MSDSIKNKVIWRLTDGRMLSKGEISELDALQVALDLDDNDPTWANIVWAWAMLPRKTDFDVAVQAISNEIRDKLTLIGTFKDDVSLKAIKEILDDLAGRPIQEVSPAPVSANVKIDEEALRETVAASIQAQGGSYAQIDFVRQFKNAVQEGVSWVWVSLAGVLFAFALAGVYIAGEAMQSHYDGAQIQALQMQVSTLTAVVAGKNSR